MSSDWVQAMKTVLEGRADPAVLEPYTPRDVVARTLNNLVEGLRVNPAHPIDLGVLVRETDVLARYFVLGAEECVPEQLAPFNQPVLLALVAGGPCRLTTAETATAALTHETLQPGAYRCIAVGTAFRLEAQGESLLLFVTGRARTGASTSQANDGGTAVDVSPDRNPHRLYLLALAGRLGGAGMRVEVQAFLEHADAETRTVAARSIAALDMVEESHGA